MAFNLSNFKSHFKGGARPNLFEADITFPTVNGAAEVGDIASKMVDFKFLCTTGEIPGSSVSQVPFNYMGRIVNYAGNRNFTSQFVTTIVNDEDFGIRLSIEKWHEKLNSTVSNIRSQAFIRDENSYTADISIKQFDRVGSELPLRRYVFIRSWPMELGPIQLSWDQNDAIEMFDVTWSYDWWESAAVTSMSVNAGSYKESIK